MTERETLRSLIGGRWAVSWPGYLLGWPFAVVFVFFSFPTITAAPTAWETAAKGLIVGTAAYAATGAVFWLASISVLRDRREAPVRITTVAIVGGIAWTARTCVLQAYLHQMGLSTSIAFPQHLVIGFLEGVIAAVLAAWVLGALDSFRTRRQLLLNELVAHELAADELAERMETMKADVLDSIREKVRDTGASLAESVTSEAPSAQDITLIREASRRVSQNVAGELWHNAARSSRLSPWAVIRSAMATRPFAYWACIPTVVVAIPTLATMWPAAKASVLLLALAAYSSLVSLIANAVTPRLRPRPALSVYVASLAALALGSPLVAEAMTNALQLTPPSGYAILPITALNFGLLVPLLGLAAHIGTAQEAVLARLRRSIDVTEIQQAALRLEEERLRRDLAVALHGGLQADLTALTMRAQQALDAGDSATARELLARARTILDSALDAPSQTHMSISEVVALAIDSWSGLVEVTVDVNLPHDPPARTAKAIEDILLEGIGNAVRHGSAHEIAASITHDGTSIRITVADDGVGVSGQRRGLGSAVLDELSPGAWSLEARPGGGSVLTVTLTAITQSV